MICNNVLFIIVIIDRPLFKSKYIIIIIISVIIIIIVIGCYTCVVTKNELITFQEHGQLQFFPWKFVRYDP